MPEAEDQAESKSVQIVLNFVIIFVLLFMGLLLYTKQTITISEHATLKNEHT